MSDPPLHTLCRICHSRPPLYTCPRCSLRTCSLACSQTHKRRVPCSGIRDPTVFKPMRQLATPAGIDHDYNFLSAIERGVERSDRHIVEDRKLVGKRELLQGPQEARGPPQRGRGGGRGGGHVGERGPRVSEAEQKVRKEMQRMGVRVERLPMGMARQKANGTSWSKKQKCVVWQVEWVRERESIRDDCQIGERDSIRDDCQTRDTNTETSGKEAAPITLDTIHSKILTTTPLLDAYTALLEEQRRAAMTPEEKNREKKRKAQEIAENEPKKPKVAASATASPEAPSANEPDERDQSREPELLDALSRAIDAADVPCETPKTSPYKFYLHRPHTPSNLPTVLIPLHHDLPLEGQLGGKVVVEFPTVYIFQSETALPEGFMLQDDFFKGKGVGRVVGSGEDGEVDSEDESADGGGELESETSSSGSSDEEEEEELKGDGDADVEREAGSADLEKPESSPENALDHTP